MMLARGVRSLPRQALALAWFPPQNAHYQAPHRMQDDARDDGQQYRSWPTAP